MATRATRTRTARTTATRTTLRTRLHRTMVRAPIRAAAAGVAVVIADRPTPCPDTGPTRTPRGGRQKDGRDDPTTDHPCGLRAGGPHRLCGGPAAHAESRDRAVAEQG